MTVRDLLQALFRATSPERQAVLSAWGRALDVPCHGVTHDSRLVQRGWVFVALRGLKADGAEFAAQAIAAGAVAIVAERDAPPASTVPWIVVSDARRALAWLAAEFFGHPSREMRVVGITGTNGKTTTSYLVRSI